MREFFESCRRFADTQVRQCALEMEQPRIRQEWSSAIEQNESLCKAALGVTDWLDA